MAKHRCHRHRILYEQGTRCPKCESARHKRYESLKRDKERSKFYMTRDWKVMRQKVIDHYCGIDIWILGKTGKLSPCETITVHHIYEYGSHPELALVFSNLIPVSSGSHNEIHAYYDSNRFEKALDIINRGIKLFEGWRTHGH